MQRIRRFLSSHVIWQLLIMDSKFEREPSPAKATSIAALSGWLKKIQDPLLSLSKGKPTMPRGDPQAPTTHCFQAESFWNTQTEREDIIHSTKDRCLIPRENGISGKGMHTWTPPSSCVCVHWLEQPRARLCCLVLLADQLLISPFTCLGSCMPPPNRRL